MTALKLHNENNGKNNDKNKNNEAGNNKKINKKPSSFILSFLKVFIISSLVSILIFTFLWFGFTGIYYRILESRYDSGDELTLVSEDSGENYEKLNIEKNEKYKTLFKVGSIENSISSKSAPDSGKIGLWFKEKIKSDKESSRNNKINCYYIVHEWSPYGKMVLKVDENTLKESKDKKEHIIFTIRDKNISKNNKFRTYEVFNSFNVSINSRLKDIINDVFPKEKKKDLAAIQVCIPGDKNHYRIIVGELIQ